jgi:hypothetical protein
MKELIFKDIRLNRRFIYAKIIHRLWNYFPSNTGAIINFCQQNYQSIGYWMRGQYLSTITIPILSGKRKFYLIIKNKLKLVRIPATMQVNYKRNMFL